MDPRADPPAPKVLIACSVIWKYYHGGLIAGCKVFPRFVTAPKGFSWQPQRIHPSRIQSRGRRP